MQWKEVSLEFVRALLEHDADPRLQNDSGSIPLGLSPRLRRRSIVEVLVEYNTTKNLSTILAQIPFICPWHLLCCFFRGNEDRACLVAHTLHTLVELPDITLKFFLFSLDILGVISNYDYSVEPAGRAGRPR